MVKFIPLGKTSIFSWLNFYLLARPLFFLNKIFIFWKNFYFFMAKLKPIGKPLPFDKTFIFS